MINVVPEAALQASSSEMGSIWVTYFNMVAASEVVRFLAAIGEQAFTTSGTTGHPLAWTRSSTQLVQEARVTVDVLGHAHDAVHSTVPPESLYGYVAILVAASLRVPYTYDRWGTRRAQINGSRPIVFSIPPSWQYLPSTLERFFNASGAGAATLVHAGARLPALADETLQAQRRRGRDIKGIELFGTTETGIVASRKFTTTHETPWNLIPDVQLTSDAPSSIDSTGDPIQPLTVRSPRLGRCLATAVAPRTITTGDLVAVTSGTIMRFVGRSNRRVKPGGGWVDLDHLDAQLRGLLDGRDFVTRMISDPLWGEHVELVVDARFGDDAGNLHRMLRQHSNCIDIVPIRVLTAALEWSPMGKARTPTPKASPPGAGGTSFGSYQRPRTQNSLTPKGRATR